MVVDYVKATYQRKVGVTNCRKIAGSSTWSQHAWSNAADIYVSDYRLGDKIVKDIREKFGSHIKVVLWWTRNHYDHIHVDMWPTGIYTPPCAGGALRVRHKDGRYGREFTADLEGENLVTVEQLQTALNDAGRLGKDGKVLTVDGIYGPNTHFAWVSALSADPAESGVTVEEVKEIVGQTKLVP